MGYQRVLVCGDREWDDIEGVWKVLDRVYEKYGVELLIITGGARGADDIARKWAVTNAIDHVTRYAHWSQEGTSAGPQRNKRMLMEHDPHLVIAFHDDLTKSKGTRGMISLAEKAGTRVLKFHHIEGKLRRNRW